MSTLLTDENFEREISSTEKLVIVDFFATWCEPCTMLAPILEKVAEELKDKVVLMKANVDNTQKNSGKYGVEKIPTVVLFKNGKPVSGFVGMAPEESIKEWLASAEKETIVTEAKMVSEEIPQEQIIAEIMERYDNYAKSNGFRLNPNKAVVEGIIKGLLANESKHGKKFCPCRIITGETEEDNKKVCPCVWHKDEIAKDGHCLCNLYVK